MAFKILSKLGWLMRLKLGTAVFLFAKPLRETKKKKKKIISKE